ncbi:MAG: DNA-directed RNA polymerase subunit D [Candidatus Hadarchaeia archaeon]
MELEIKESKDDVLRFILSDTNPSFANSIRRVIVQGVKVMAVDEVEIAANDSVMSDEILAHRLGQMPLSTPDGYLSPSECDCREGRCANCSVTLSFNGEGPGMIRAGDLESSDPDVFPVQEETPIVRLDDDQVLSFEAIARLGYGRDHSNWQSAIASYKYMPVLDIDQDARDDWSPCVDACPQEILKEEDGKLEVTDIEKCTICGACSEVCPESIEVSGDSSTFIFKVESTGSLKPQEAVRKSLEVLGGKCEEFVEKLEMI